MQWAEKCKIEAFYVLCSGSNHYCGGTSKGMAFLKKVPSDFWAHLGQVHSVQLVMMYVHV